MGFDMLMRNSQGPDESAAPAGLFVSRFSADGSRVFVCGVGGFTTRVLDAATGASIYEGSDKMPHLARFSDDGGRIAECRIFTGLFVVDPRTKKSTRLVV